MNEEIAKLLINSLIGRLIRTGASYRVPEGLLSSEEMEAMRLLTGAHAAEPAPSLENLPPKKIDLVLTACSSQGPSEEDLRICIDFGTAMSKAWATGQTFGATLPLVLGKSAGDGDNLVVPSSIYIGRNGQVYLGADADRMFRQEVQPGRFKFENLKRMLSEAEVDSDLFSMPLKPGIDPTDSGLHQGDLLVLYLAWLTDHALQALSQAASEVELPGVGTADLRYVRRRFAIPCFEHAVDEVTGGGERARWAFEVMRDAVLRAQIVADTLGGQWQGLSVQKVLDVLRQVRGMDVRSLDGLLSANASIREPIAAGASRFSDEFGDGGMSRAKDSAVRRFLMVVDAGAGTTDFAVFQVIDRGGDSEMEYILIKPSVRMSRIAGNAIDELLRPSVLTACGIDPNSGNPRSKDDFDYIRADLTARIRDIKREMFDKGEVPIRLKPNARGTLTRDEFVRDATYVEYGRELKAIRDEALKSVFDPAAMESYRLRCERLGKPIPVHLLLTGGSAALPIIRDLADGEVVIDGARFAFRLVEDLPKWVGSLPREAAAQMATVYSQAAVAIGGSAPTLPVEMDDRAGAIDPSLPGVRVITTYQVTGVNS